MSSPPPEQLLVDQIPHLRRYSRALMRDREVADDLLQDVLARAWSRLHLWRPGTNMRTWVFAIMHNLHANFVRDRSRRPTPVELDPSSPRLSDRARQADGLELAAVETALAELPVDQRAVLLLVGLEGFSYQEAADTLAIPVGTVMSRLHRGRERLRALLADGAAPKRGRA